MNHFNAIPHFNASVSEILYRINLYCKLTNSMSFIRQSTCFFIFDVVVDIFRPNCSMKATVSVDRCLIIILNSQLLSIEAGKLCYILLLN